MKLHHKAYGQGPPLIILHGLFGSLENWHYISSQLAPQFHVLAVDQRNHGRSPHAPEMDYLAMAADLLEFVEEHSLRTADLLGHSMGGKTAMQFAMLHPERVRRLLVVDIAPRQYPPAHKEILEAMLGLDPSRYSSRLEMDQVLAAKIPDAAVRQFLLKSVARDSHGRFYWRLNLDAISKGYDHITAALPAERVCHLPALFISGEMSDYLRIEDQPSVLRLFPHARFAAVAGASHWVHAEAPSPFLKTVESFLAGATRASDSSA